MQSVSHVFISYAHEDGDFADKLKERIRRQGISGWMDSEKIRAGKDWRQEIDQAIRDSFALVTIVSPDAKQSEYVTYEWSFALGIGLEVIPVMLRKTNLHARLDSLQYLDFTSQDRKSRPWRRLYEHLKVAQEDYGAKNRPSSPLLTHVVTGYLNSNEGDTRRSAAMALGCMRDPSAVASLQEHVGDSNADVRAAVLSALSNIGDVSVIPAIVSSLHDPTHEVRQAAVDAIVRIGKPAVSNLIDVLQDKEDAIIIDGRQAGRINAIFSLKRIRDEEAIPALVEALDDEDVIIRGVAADALGGLKAEIAVQSLIRLLDDDEELSWFYGIEDPVRVDQIAAGALSRIDTPEAQAAYHMYSIPPS